jgi:hypothetical protein
MPREKTLADCEIDAGKQRAMDLANNLIDARRERDQMEAEILARKNIGKTFASTKWYKRWWRKATSWLRTK